MIIARADVGVVIIHYGDMSITERCLSSLSEQISPDHIVIVANSPVPEKWQSDATVLPQTSNGGYGSAVNVGAKFAQSQGWTKLVVTNNDVVFLPDSLSALVFEIHDGGIQTVVSPLVLWGDSNTVLSYGGRLSKWRAIGLNGFTSRPIPPSHVRNRMPPQTFLSGCCFGAPVDLLVRYPFESDYFLYYEDARWCMSLQSVANIHLIAAKESCIRHYPSSTTRINSPLYLYYNTRNRLFFANSIGGFPGLTAVLYTLLGVLKNFSVQSMSGNRAGARAVLTAVRDFSTGRFGRRDDLTS